MEYSSFIITRHLKTIKTYKLKTMKLSQLFLFLLSAILVVSCIEDDFVNDTIDPELRITSTIDTIAINTTFQFESMYLNNIGLEEEVSEIWTSSNPSVIEINSEGLATALSTGQSTISVEFLSEGILLRDSMIVAVGEETIVQVNSFEGSIRTTTFYDLEGDFVYTETESGVNLSFADNYLASAGLPGLFIYLSNNNNSIANALEIGAVEVFSGAHEYDVEGVGFNDYKYIVYFCKPFNVKVGEGEL